MSNLIPLIHKNKLNFHFAQFFKVILEYKFRTSFLTNDVCPENSLIYPVKILPSYLETIQPCRLQSTPFYSVRTAAYVSSMF